MNKNYIYLVEGKCEEVFIKNIKDKYIKSGVIKIVNVAKERIKNELLRKMTINLYVILVFDTDVINFEILLDNKKRLEKEKNNWRYMMIIVITVFLCLFGLQFLVYYKTKKKNKK